MDYLGWFPERIAELRTQRGVSARDMSLSLGQSESYINKIENRRTLPSMAGFFYICDYLAAPRRARELMEELERLRPEQADHVLQIVRDLTEKG